MTEITLEMHDMEEYFDPIDEAVEPPFEFMMIKARQEESREMRRTVASRVSQSAPVKSSEPVANTRRRFANPTAVKE